MNQPVRVLIVDDDALVRAGLVMMLDGTHGISVVGEAADGNEVLSAVDAHSPDVVLMDLRMPGVDGFVATQRLRARSNGPEIIVLTTFDTDENVLLALRCGASGFLLKDTPAAQIVDAVRRVAQGDAILSPKLIRKMIDRAVTAATNREQARSALRTLSPRELDVAVAIAQGKTNAEIGIDLQMTVATAKAHISRILTKLGLTNRTQIALLVHDAGLT